MDYYLQGNHECEIAYGGEADLHKHLIDCKKNPGHVNFIPVNDFNLDHLPSRYRDVIMLELIKALSALTVLIKVNYTSLERPESVPCFPGQYPFYNTRGSEVLRTGTGRVCGVVKYTESDNKGTCPCGKCQHSDTPSKVWGEISVGQWTQENKRRVGGTKYIKYTYTTATCTGSSGAPIYTVRADFMSHAHSGTSSKEENYSGEWSLKLLNITFMDNANKIITCTDKAMLRISETVTDILCHLDVTVVQVYLDFRETVALCSVYIDGGRNVALKQPTTQSSDYSEAGVVYDSSRAVDGNPSGDFNGQNSCSHTFNTPNSTWTVLFNQPRDVNRYVLYNRGLLTITKRLKGFNLVSYNAQHIALFNYTDTNPSDTVMIYNVTTTGTKAVASITIIAKDVDNILTLCEVEVYGYDSCPKGTYSIGCSSTCNCRDESESCFVATGQCWSGCAIGYQSEGCSQPCAETYYGEDCAQRCSTNCPGQLCNNVDGTCRSCPVGKDGPYCEQECKEHRYGANCNMTCPPNCLNNLCNSVTGQCLACVAGYTGAMCDLECAATYFGENCRRRCSSTCLDRLCNNTDGLCVSCVVGRTGDFCEKDVECKTSNGICSTNQQLSPLTSSVSDRLADGVGIGVGAMCGVVIIIVSVGCIVRKVRATSGRETRAHRKNNHQDVSASGQSSQTSHNKATGNASTNLSCYDNLGVDETLAATYETISIHDVN
ncbi:uncharacterized protein LOC131945845 [Physella acuta]|uniref:uncharacterized protein LOC131945845 n=1 Tax=Physella acuta TaxID=109671 RepID=UPI0027DE4021|nr:uncharacterized protein LOC131945845 [Physella acuta]